MPFKDNTEKKLDKITTLFVEAALRARIFDAPGFENPEAVADYCAAIAKRIAEESDDG